jgi:hypothetical protein
MERLGRPYVFTLDYNDMTELQATMPYILDAEVMSSTNNTIHVSVIG